MFYHRVKLYDKYLYLHNPTTWQRDKHKKKYKHINSGNQGQINEFWGHFRVHSVIFCL
jgi:hypothetical protein